MKKNDSKLVLFFTTFILPQSIGFAIHSFDKICKNIPDAKNLNCVEANHKKHNVCMGFNTGIIDDSHITCNQTSQTVNSMPLLRESLIHDATGTGVYELVQIIWHGYWVDVRSP